MIIKEFFEYIEKEKKKRLRSNSPKKLTLCIGISTLAGLAAGILLAPKSGQETRVNIKRKADEIKNDPVKNIETIKNSANHAASEFKNSIKDVNQKVETIKNTV